MPTGSYLPHFREVPAAAPSAAVSSLAAGPGRPDWTWPPAGEPREVPTSPLPVPRTSLIGRDVEVAAILAALRDGSSRVLTLAGPGGSGKTRLALQVAAEADADGDFPGGVSFVSLGSLADAADVAPTLAQALGLSRIERGSVDDALRAHVRATVRARTLLVLDNFEQLLAAAPLLVGLIESTTALTLLVTSRAILHVSGEQCIPVRPLPVPDLARLPPLDALARNPAVALFVRQAAARQPAFALTADNAAPIAEICARLDGLPLAIELAAARVRILSPAQMLGRLERRLALLTGGGPDLPVRQQTLRQAIDWSHELLTDAEKRLFRRLAVFAGSCTLEAAEAVCNPRQDPGLSVLDGMSSLVDKSLIQEVDAAPDDRRFAMLETVREYALEQLDASGEHPVTRRAHAAYCLVLAEEGLGPVTAAQREAWLARCQREHENHRAAFDHLIATHDDDWALRLALALSDYWDRHDHRLEGFARFQALLRLPGLAARTKARATAIAYGSLLSPVLEATRAEQEALSIYRELGDLRGVVGQLNNLGVNYRFVGDYARARACLEESVSICRQLGDRLAVATALSNLADVRRRQGDYADARAALAEAHELFGQVGHRIGQAWSAESPRRRGAHGRRSDPGGRPLPARRRPVPRPRRRDGDGAVSDRSRPSGLRGRRQRDRARAVLRRAGRIRAPQAAARRRHRARSLCLRRAGRRRPRARADPRRRGGGRATGGRRLRPGAARPWHQSRARDRRAVGARRRRRRRASRSRRVAPARAGRRGGSADCGARGRPLVVARVLLVVARVEQLADRGDAVDGQARQAGMGDDQALVRRVVDAVHLVVGDEAVNPLDVGPEVGQGTQRRQGRVANLGLRPVGDPGHDALDDELRHAALG